MKKPLSEANRKPLDQKQAAIVSVIGAIIIALAAYALLEPLCVYFLAEQVNYPVEGESLSASDLTGYWIMRDDGGLVGFQFRENGTGRFFCDNEDAPDIMRLAYSSGEHEFLYTIGDQNRLELFWWEADLPTVDDRPVRVDGDDMSMYHQHGISWVCTDFVRCKYIANIEGEFVFIAADAPEDAPPS